MKQKENQLWCDGPSGHDREDGSYAEHPRVYFAWGDDGRATCPYCGRFFESGLKVDDNDA